MAIGVPVPRLRENVEAAKVWKGNRKKVARKSKEN